MITKEEQLLKQVFARIGQKLKQLRHEKGYTSYESFAYDYGLPRAQYWRMENGHSNITIKSLVKVLLIHGLTLEEFF